MAEQKPNKFYLTTPIYYVNARPHIGHAYTTIVADVLARRHRLLGEDVFFLTGTDEHGQKIERSAAAANIPPQQFADQVSASFRALWDRMGITYTRFIRTTSPEHKLAVQKLWRQLEASGDIYLDSYTGAYCVSDETFVDLPVGAPCPDCGRPLEQITEENYFFRLSKYQLDLINLIESGTLAVEPETRRNEVLSFLRGNISAATEPGTQTDTQSSGAPFTAQSHRDVGGNESPSPATSNIAYSAKGTPYLPGALKDLSISRSSFKWGIPVPEDLHSSSRPTGSHVIYVWLDALTNYISALGYGSPDESNFEKYWPAQLHLVGKEIIRFHCVYWPAFLLAAGLPLPKKVQAHGWLLFEESKMSKSRGNIVRTETILEAFGNEVYAKQFPDSTPQDRDLFAADVLRYFLLREIPFGNDGSFSFDALITRYNAELANGYGNLVSRTLAMIQKYFDGEILKSPNATRDTLTTDIEAGILNFGKLIEANEFHKACELAQTLVAITDIDLSVSAPWKSGPDEAMLKSNRSAVLYAAAESIRIITALLNPILPYTTAKVWHQLGLGNIEQAAQNGDLKNLQWGGLKPGTKLGPLAPIFPRADKGLAQIMTNIENPTPEAPTTPGAPLTRAESTPAPAPTADARVGGGVEPPEPETPTITIDDFAKIDLRAATILVAERIPKADKLLRLEVDLGPGGRRQILSGIAEHYTPEELIGRRIVIIANLAPRKMRGLESHGMLLAASEGPENGNPPGKPILATFAEEIAPGSRLK